MYSYAQCTVQERLVCGGDVPCLAHMEQGSGPSTLSTYLPPYLPGVMGTQFIGSLQEGWIWTVEWRFAASPTQILCFWIMYVILSLFHLESCFWRVYQIIVCLVLIAVIFLGWLTTTRNKRVLPCAFITFSWAVSQTPLLHWFSSAPLVNSFLPKKVWILLEASFLHLKSNFLAVFLNFLHTLTVKSAIFKQSAVQAQTITSNAFDRVTDILHLVANFQINYTKLSTLTAAICLVAPRVLFVALGFCT